MENNAFSLNEDVASQIPEELPTLPQLERALGQVVQAKYRAWTGHRASRTICRIKSNTVTLIIQSSVTLVEKLTGDAEIEHLRRSINDQIKPRLLCVITEFLGVKSSSIMLDTNLNSGETGAIVVLEKEPIVRSSKRSPR